MTSDRNSRLSEAETTPASMLSGRQEAARYRLANRFFAGHAVSETVITQMHMSASPETVWNHVMLYEEVPGRAPFLLRTFLPRPIHTEGDKTCVGARVCCVYSDGNLIKRITTADPPHVLQFEVVEQRLGIEDCVLTVGGSYRISSCGDASDVTLITNYQAYWHPRNLWRRLEGALVRQLHSHILRGVCAAVAPENSTTFASAGTSHILGSTPRGVPSCPSSQSYFHR